MREPEKQRNVITAMKNDALVVGGYTYHGGCTYILVPEDKEFQYHASGNPPCV
jgi:hypothetical protein